MKSNICPKCGRTYQGYPALSRKDNRTEICPDCGIREALDDAGIDPWSQMKITACLISFFNCLK